MSAIDLLLSRLDHPRPNGRDRWRCACPVCGGRNRSTLSVGLADSGVVLLTCFKEGCGADEIAAALGLMLEDLFPARDSSASPMRRRRLLTAQQALEVLEFESTLVWTAGCNVTEGHALTAATSDGSPRL